MYPGLRTRGQGALRVLLICSLLLALLAPTSATAAQDKCVLLFPSSTRYGLEAEEKYFEHQDSLTVRAQNLITLVLAEMQSGRVPLYPKGVGLRHVFVDRNGTAFVDLKKSGAEAMGAAEEYLSLMAIVSTLCLNINEIKNVKILVNGDEALTLFGHVDLSRPLLPDQHLVE